MTWKRPNRCFEKWWRGGTRTTWKNCTKVWNSWITTRVGYAAEIWKGIRSLGLATVSILATFDVLAAIATKTILFSNIEYRISKTEYDSFQCRTPTTECHSFINEHRIPHTDYHSFQKRTPLTPLTPLDLLSFLRSLAAQVPFIPRRSCPRTTFKRCSKKRPDGTPPSTRCTAETRNG